MLEPAQLLHGALVGVWAEAPQHERYVHDEMWATSAGLGTVCNLSPGAGCLGSGSGWSFSSMSRRACEAFSLVAQVCDGDLQGVAPNGLLASMELVRGKC